MRAGISRVVAGHSRRSRLLDRDRGRTGRQTLSVAHAAASRRQPCPARRRSSSATNRPANRRRLIPPHPFSYRKCSAKPVFRNGFRRPVNMLQIRTVEDQFDEQILAAYPLGEAAVVLDVGRAPMAPIGRSIAPRLMRLRHRTPMHLPPIFRDDPKNCSQLLRSCGPRARRALRVCHHAKVSGSFWPRQSARPARHRRARGCWLAVAPANEIDHDGVLGIRADDAELVDEMGED
jgi:hypothetical protein